MTADGGKCKKNEHVEEHVAHLRQGDDEGMSKFYEK